MRRFSENKVPCHTLIVHPARDCTPTMSRWAVRSVTIPYNRSENFQGEPHFLFTVRLFSDS
jgi:hypothetical protein